MDFFCCGNQGDWENFETSTTLFPFCPVLPKLVLPNRAHAYPPAYLPAPSTTLMGLRADLIVSSFCDNSAEARFTNRRSRKQRDQQRDPKR